LASHGQEMNKHDTAMKSDSQTPVTMLTEVENVINSLFVEFEAYEKDDSMIFNQEQILLKKHNRKLAAEENIASLKIAIEEKN